MQPARLTGVLLTVLMLFAIAAPAAAQDLAGPTTGQSVPASPQMTTDVPSPMVYSGVHSFYLAAPKVFWDSNAYCPPPPPHLAAAGEAATAETAAAANAAAPTAPSVGTAAGDPVTIQRVRTTGGPVRDIFVKNDPRDPGACNPYSILSNIVADDQYLYWLDASGLQKLSVEANPGDAPQQLMGAFWSSTDSLELAVGPNAVYGIAAGHIWGARKDQPSGGFEIGYSTDYPGRLSYHDGGLYYMAAGNLYRFDTADNSTRLNIDLSGKVTAYAYDAAHNWVYVAEGATVYAYNLAGKDWVYTNILIIGHPPARVIFYTAGDSQTVNPAVRAMTSDGANLFVFDERKVNCGGLFCNSYDHLLRVPIKYSIFVGWYGDTPADLYIFNTADNNFVDAGSTSNLSTDNTFLFFKIKDQLLRLANNAAALPKVNVRPTGLEITQGIQRSDNSVVLVQNRTTFVRVFVKSDGAAVPDVGALLYGSWSGVESSGPIFPSNGRIVVQPAPNNLDYNQQYVFQLPYEWTQQPDLRLYFTINPYGVPLEPNYGDNNLAAGPFAFQQSPQLDLIFAEFSYALNDTTFKPQGLLSNVGWINSAYPLGYNIKNGEWRFGLNYNVWDIPDSNNALARRVGRMSPECDAYVTYNPDKTIKKDDREFCASDYTNTTLASLRSARHVPDGTFIYGEIPDSSGAGGQFPRGQAGGSKVSSGPDATTWNGFYAGHEVGHTVGGGHPKSGDKECNLDGSDPIPAYPHAHIGPDDNSITGFYPSWVDLGGGSWRMGTILKGSDWTDVMAYCRSGDWPHQWISDKNYERFYNNIPKPPLVAAAAVSAPAQPLAGDFLSVYGSIAPDGSAGIMNQVRRLSTVDNIPPIAPGGYAIRLSSASNTPLAEYAFTPGDADSGWMPFGQVVNFVGGTAKIELVRLSDNTVLASKNVSANPPVVSSVAAPVDAGGNQLTLSWVASDPDGGALTFDILYSRDGGVTFQPVQFGVTGTSTTIDTSLLGGSTTALFQVIASDGVNTAYANSPQFTMAPKPPLVQILTPADGIHVNWGDVVNLSGTALDLQDGSLSGGSLVWSNQKGVLGTGALLSTVGLPVGVNTITLQATNSQGQQGSASITVVVGDDLSVAGPNLSVEPGAVTWNLPSGVTALQNATLSLANTGGGAITWQAASDQGWLTLDAASGALPGTLQLTANPAGLPDGQNQATVTLNALDGSSQIVQTVTVPVTLWIGDPGYQIITEPPPPGGASSQDLYMPYVRR